MKPRVLSLCIIAVLTQSALAKTYPEAEWKARFTYRPFPDYPTGFRARRMQGSGIFRMHVDEHGTVTAITIVKSTGYRDLDVLTMKALIQWNGRPGPKWELDMPVTFTLDRNYRPKHPEDAKHYP